MYIWQRGDWPAFRWDSSRLILPLSAAARRYGLLVGRLRHLNPGSRLLVQSDALTEDAVQSSGIEGEVLSRDNVRASARQRLGFDPPERGTSDHKADGAVAMLLDATREPERPLYVETLFSWHAALFQDGWSGLRRITVASWRPGPELMQGLRMKRASGL